MPTPIRERAAALFRELQDSICAGLLDVEERAVFAEDEWRREGGGGGRTRVMSGGATFEKGGVNVSEVWGELGEELAARLPGSGRAFHASGVSLVLHPANPHVPAVHANFRHIERGGRAWFGGGADLTPFYWVEEDRDAFHGVWRRVCGEHPEVADYAAWSAWCDRYFWLPHRGERRGAGGIFFDDVASSVAALAFVEAAGRAFLDAYLPIVRRRRSEPFTPGQRAWQEARRGRYVEFNLLHDRGTLFGLRTGGRIESILMSLPPVVRWPYAHEPEAGTPEARLLAELRRPPPPA